MIIILDMIMEYWYGYKLTSEDSEGVTYEKIRKEKFDVYRHILDLELEDGKIYVFSYLLSSENLILKPVGIGNFSILLVLFFKCIYLKLKYGLFCRRKK